ncbi:lysosomal alpha-mannosidase [Biomphalaria glabrata]|nr:lysosomal alpha-mannosidase [Biomphalaria glabrata]
MRLSLKRSLTWVVALVLLQLVVYYWSLKRPRRLPPKLTLPRYTQTHPSNEGTCSFKTCPAVKEGYLNVHIVPHSHTDVGWLKTVDQYYTGEIPADIGQELGCVRCTLESTIRELEKNKDRRFVFIEMKYFSRYWNEIKDSERELIRTLIRERRLELVGGGWVMSDAGVTMYNDIIDQHTLGFDFIADTFGSCAQTRTGWHVDQFGHSREHASIFAQMGFDSLFVSRIDFEDLAERKRTKNMEFVWYTSPLNLRNRSSLFTQVTYDGYYAPNGYVFDSGSSSSLKVSELDAVHFLKIIKLRAQSYKSKHILVPMGSDFGYKNAETWFQYLDPLIKAANEIGSPGFQMNFLYSTPSCYTYYVNKEKLTYEVKKDDFLPYSVPPSAFWTGYYTTRGGFKKFIKLAGQILQGEEGGRATYGHMEKKVAGQHIDIWRRRWKDNIWAYGEEGGKATYGHMEKKVAGQHMGIWRRRWQGNIWAYGEEGGRATYGQMEKKVARQHMGIWSRRWKDNIWAYGEEGGKATYGHMKKKVEGQHMGIWRRRWQGNIWAYGEEGDRASYGHMEKKVARQHMGIWRRRWQVNIWAYGEEGGRATYGHMEKKVAGQHMGIWRRRWQGNIWAYGEEGGRATYGHMEKKVAGQHMGI